MRHVSGNYYVYIMTGHSRRLYIGVTNDLTRRVQEHRSGLLPGFTKQYNLTQLAYYEHFGRIDAAIAREKILKGWSREKKLRLIETMNPGWLDLSNGIIPCHEGRDDE